MSYSRLPTTQKPSTSSCSSCCTDPKCKRGRSISLETGKVLAKQAPKKIETGSTCTQKACSVKPDTSVSAVCKQEQNCTIKTITKVSSPCSQKETSSQTASADKKNWRKRSSSWGDCTRPFENTLPGALDALSQMVPQDNANSSGSVTSTQSVTTEENNKPGLMEKLTSALFGQATTKTENESTQSNSSFPVANTTLFATNCTQLLLKPGREPLSDTSQLIKVNNRLQGNSPLSSRQGFKN